MKTKIAVAIILILCWKWSLCQQVTIEEAIAVAKTELLYTKGFDVNVIDVHQFDSNGHTLLYEVVSDRGINVLVAGNRMCLPVVGRYETAETTSIFDECEKKNCGLKMFVQSYKEQIEYSFQTQDMESTHELEWRRLLNRENIYSNRDIGYVEPLIKTHWRQGWINGGGYPAVYNYYIPSGDTCEHCLAGCVAVAMGQVMNYWKWPVLTTDNWQFDWCNMPEALVTSSEDYTLERNAVARLLERCGYRTKMNYGCDGSESNVYKAKKALDKFGYNEESDHQWRILNRRTWIRHLRENLDSGWPVIYGASGDPDININIDDLSDPEVSVDIPAHAFVCDGYSNDGKFHFNWGLNPNYNGYYTVDSLCPGNHDYNLFNSALFDLRPPEETISFCDISLPLETFYQMYIISNPDSNVALYNVTPQTFKQLTSAPASYAASFRTIPAGAIAEYVAHEEIVLQPGFTAEYGSDFTARIEPCDACEERMAQAPVERVEEPCAWQPGEPSNDNRNRQDIDTPQQEMHLYKKGDTTILFQPSELTLFPNPASNTLTVQAPNPVDNVQLFDIAGHSVYRWYVESRTDNSTTLNIANIPTGNYILRIQTSDGKTHIGRFAKK